VDLPAGKNLMGAFWQPRFVLADPATLATLPRRELVAGYGEVLKYALLGDPDQLGTLDAGAPLARQADVVRRCAAQKAAVVSADEREQTGARATLNLGHTVGHAIEAASFRRPAPLLHGEAVALGLVAAARVSRGAGLCGPDLEAQVAAACVRLGLPADLGPWRGDEVMQFLGVDKKREGARLRFIGLERPGVTRLVDLAPAEIVAFLRSP
jgi:3-dehydroquinate synthetase